MRIRVVAFATAAHALGAAERRCDLAEGATVSDLERLLTRDSPPLAEQWSRFAIAVNGELVRDNRALADGDEVALLPPVSGG